MMILRKIPFLKTLSDIHFEEEDKVEQPIIINTATVVHKENK